MADVVPTSELKDNPYVAVVAKKLRNLKKK
jgi:hypothetical protein